MKHGALLITLAVLTLSMACCCCCTDLSNIDWETWARQFEEIEVNWGVTVTPEPTVETIREEVTDVALETEILLAETDIPVRDLHDLAIRLRGLPPDTPRTINPAGPPDYPVGTRRLFYASNVDTDQQFEVYAIMQYKTDHVYMWVEEGVSFNASALAAAAELFESQTYPTNRAFFGSEWTPGVDNDPRLSILHARNLGSTVAGYYSSADQFVSAVRPDSNEMEMFYINIQNVTINDDFYNGVLAHEFQHMIHWYNDRNEDTWLNEGFSELAMFLNGFDIGGSDYSFARRPDTQLNSWPEGPGAAAANYGAAYLFTSYFLHRFGPDATRALVAHDENGLASVDAVLAELGYTITHVDLFADWTVANLLDDPSLDPRFGYADIRVPNMTIDATHTTSNLPVDRQTTVSQYGTDYIEIQADRPLRLSFTGSTLTRLLDTEAYSGRYLWWSNRGDDSNMTLTREFDLSGVDSATLDFWTWYSIEVDWDYAYVMASTDDGGSWTILTTPNGTPTDPNGNSFGWAYTGNSGGWINQQVDLTPFAGRSILLRFEYITDDAVNQPGFAIDDVSIPEIGYFSDFEADGGGWHAEGFIRHANVLPQRWLVQLVLYGPQTTVERLELEPDQTGTWQITLGGDTRRATLIVSAYAPVTTEIAGYRYQIEQW